MEIKQCKMKPVLLIFPGKTENRPTIPFSSIVLASYLRKYKIPVEVIDTRVQQYEDINFDNYSLIGISAKSGEQLSSAVKLCKFIRKKSKTPIVWGGPHATLLPEQTCNSYLVDFVIKGEGEETLLELIKAIEKGGNFKKIEGLVYKENNKVIQNKDRNFIDMDKLDIPAYDLINLDKYQDKINYFYIETSRGCPYRCSFCYAQRFHKCMWRNKSLKKVFGEIKQIMKEYNVKKFIFSDDNFFVNKKRVINFCKQVIEKRMDVEFYGMARANYISYYSDIELKLLRDAGFKFLNIGAESGSQLTLNNIKKDLKIEEILMSAKKCIKNGIIPVYSFMIGTPKETWVDLNKTIEIYFKLKEISPNVEISGFFIFTPYPETPLYEEALKIGYTPRNTLEEWATWKFSDMSNITWLNRKQKFNLQILSRMILFLFVRDRMRSYGGFYKKKKIGSWFKVLLWEIGSPLLSIDAQFRLKNKLFFGGYEWILFGFIALNFFKVT